MSFPRPCKQFAKTGACSHKACRNGHPQPLHAPLYLQAPGKDIAIQSWKRTARAKCTSHIAPESIEAFFVGAKFLVERDAESMQEVISYMSKESGLRYIEQLVEREFSALPPASRIEVFRSQVIPFLETISHPRVLASLVAENALGAIYNFVYGLSGSRAASLISSICSVLEALSEDDETRAEWLEDSLAVFHRIILQDILTSMDKGDMSGKLHISRRYMNQLTRNGEEPTHGHGQIIKFVPRQELPGGRHDNDHKDFSLIQIMPTIEEILSPRQEYLPERDSSSWHVSGLDGLLDRNFRLLREDNVGIIRDAIHHIIKAVPEKSPRANVYKGARIIKFKFHWNAGFVFQVSFPQPPRLRRLPAPQREAWWTESRRLQPGTLVCLTINGDHAAFCTVTHGPDEQSHIKDKKATRVGSSLKGEDQVFVMLTTLGPDERTVRSIVDFFDDRGQSFFMTEFPGVLLPSFEPTLRALQRIKTTNRLPFDNFLVPSRADVQTMIPPPLYSLRDGFQFNLRCLMTDDADFFVQPDKRVDPERLYSNSILDQAQARALVNSLQHCIGLIQGPPGTGKSYTGIALIEVLLANRYANSGNIGPILCVSYTNHALDQLLEFLLDRKITKNIVRIGSQSKSERLAGCILRDISRLATKTREEKSMQKSLRYELKRCEDKFNRLSFRQIPASKVPPYLFEYYPNHFEQLFYSDEYDLEPSQVKNPGAIIKAWLTSGMGSENEPGRSFKDLVHVNIYSMTQAERTTVYNQWLEDIAEETLCEAVELVSAHAGIKHNWDRIRSEVDLRCLADADVIGVTTTGLANNLEMLQKLQVKVVICEEAGEVLEAHLLTALLPSIEHAIFIGDHLQLCPVVQNYDLSRENPNGGVRYSLDVSLFERLVSPKSAFGADLPYSMLETQRRMHPSIAGLIRDTLYPDLKDAACVSEYPRVSGMKRRLFWLDHRSYEGNTADDAVATSYWNEHEVEMAVALVNHLVSQGDRKSGEIAVLTPYLGQLHRLRQRLSKLFAICIGERDQEDLEKAGLKPDNNVGPAVKSNLLDALRVSTVDNFQGEEAKVVVISLVRSNPQNRCGFLSTPNRINVLLSRAQHGMYILGNSETSRHIPMWAQVIKLLKQDDNFGPKLHLECSRHPNAVLVVSEPNDFLRLSPEGGCNLRCTKRLKCGHACEQRCHSDMLHNAAFCGQPCSRTRVSCAHPCPELCGNICPFNCTALVTRDGRKLPCGHLMETLPCFQDRDTTKFDCVQLVRKTVARCKHEISAPCYLDVSASSYQCTSPCGAQLSCGHTCSRKCNECNTLDGVHHGVCRQQCACHGTEPCPPCEAACEVRCKHSKCTRKCYEPCTPGCTLPCAAPCNHIPCSRRCEKLLRCGHQCPSVCGEQCPPARFCRICAKDAVKNHQVDFILEQSYENINLDKSPCIFPRCGHFLTVESMDAQMDLARYYTLDKDRRPVSIKEGPMELSRMADIKNCALCRGHLRDIARYGRLKFILYLNREYLPLAEEMARRVQSLKDLDYKQKTALSSVLQTMKGALGYLSVSRWGEILKMREQIEVYQHKVSPNQQPFVRVLAMIEIARRKSNISTDGFNDGNNMLQLKGVLLAAALNLRLHIALLTDFLRIKGRARTRLTLDLSETRNECETLIDSAEDLKLPPLEAEGRLFLAQLHALERGHCVDAEESNTHLDNGLASLKRAREVIAAFPTQTRGLESEIDAAENMFLSTFYSIVTNAERLAVVQAMANEFVGTGHWYYCGNGHPFTIGECGGAIQESLCPECGAPVGGRQHRVVDGVTRADDLEESAPGGYW
ncbi:hypothetical protein BDW74DRAFT_187491 [Aspergillus multicolor]|uniref:putative NF-X1 finger and helicase domain protein n=1 Tax=Aspergillus multicolor TaxID=41759 RepID=UPI003CCCC184